MVQYDMLKVAERSDSTARYTVAGSCASSAMLTIAMGQQSSCCSELLPNRGRKSGNREDI
jgi:hypothetical protein